MIGAIKTLRELEINGTLSNHYGDGINYSVSNLNGNILPQTSLKHKNHNELNNKKEKINIINTRTHENFSQVKETNRF
ncbi:hypothetical protein [Helicobacter pylori]|uniref:hypothetical protein n=1 Tax=Helicobacter pylori TaxID=210 RepID=UPI001FD30782|nr:hypothetical protein [Helicobacter pylori]UOS06924.1 hypothetical protein MPF93_05375 [Helicobacter pylori]